MLRPAAPAERPAERAAPVLVPALSPAVAHHPQTHAVPFQLSHEVSTMGQQGVQVERLAVGLVEQGLVPEAKLPAHLAEPRKSIAVPDVCRFSELCRITLAHELNNLAPAIPQHDRALNKA